MGEHTPLIDLMRLERVALKQRRKVLKLRERLQDEEDLLTCAMQASVLARASVEQPEPVPPAPRAAATAGLLDYSEPSDGQSSPPDSGGSGAATSTGVRTAPEAGSTPEPAGSSLRHGYAPPTSPHRGGSAWGKRAKDETGKRYGKLVVLTRVPNTGSLARWRCRCDCGAETVVAGAWLRAGRVTQCPTCGRTERACSVCGDRGHFAQRCPQRPENEPAVAEGFKRCCQCRTVKPVAEFYANAIRGHQARCKVCDNQTRVANRGGTPGGPRGRPKVGDCTTCSSMPSRVEGARCSACGLEAEAPLRATDFTSSGMSSLGRAS